MNSLLKTLIRHGYESFEHLEPEDKEEILSATVFSRARIGNVVTVWECLTPAEKEAEWASLYERVNDEDVDFGHSQCCTAIEQAAAFMLTQWALEEELEHASYFDDLDFVTHPLPKVKVKEI
jgi:hypothetical protein